MKTIKEQIKELKDNDTTLNNSISSLKSMNTTHVTVEALRERERESNSLNPVNGGDTPCRR